MRAIWKGAISFGLVSIPVKLYSATEQKDVSFHQVHGADGGRIRYRRVCTVDGQEVAYQDIAKGYELPGGEVVVLTDEDFAELPLSTSRSIDVLEFVPLEQVDPIFFDRSYYLEPEPAGAKAYVLLRQALEGSGRVALVKVALRQRESLATLRVRDGVFVLEMMLWPDEIREPDFAFLDEAVDVRPQEVQMAGSLIETLAGDFHPEQYSDDYRVALQQLIEAKVAGREVVAPPEPAAEPGAVVDLMAALRASVEAAREQRAAGAGPAAAGAQSGRAGGRGGQRARRETAQPAAKKATKRTAKRSATRKSA
jgi:DNA end-binding protein Ku